MLILAIEGAVRTSKVKKMSEAVKTPINIYTEANPNPNSLKFVANFTFIAFLLFEKCYLEINFLRWLPMRIPQTNLFFLKMEKMECT